jgi:hypothetical protein
VIVRHAGDRVQLITQPDHSDRDHRQRDAQHALQSDAALHQALRDAWTVTLRGDVK